MARLNAPQEPGERSAGSARSRSRRLRAQTGALTEWLRELAGGPPYDELHEEAAGAGPGAGGLLALPYFAGERTPFFDPDLRGALFGLTASHRRGHVFRALLEATAFAVRQNLETMCETGATIGGLRSSGGGASHPLWPQIVSDVTGLSQDVRGGSAQAGVGAALLAAIAVGAATLDTQWRAAGATVFPREELCPLYDELYGQFRELRLSTLPHAHALAVWQRDRDELRQASGPARGPGRYAASSDHDGGIA